MDACGRELSSEVILGVQERGVLEVNGNWVAAEDFCCASCSAWTFLLHHHLVRTAKIGNKQSEQTPTSQTGMLQSAIGDAGSFLCSLLALQSIKKPLYEWRRNVC